MSAAYRYDLAVIGGGIVGAWTLWLAQQRFPQWRIVLVERSRNGDGATAHSAGVLLTTGSTPRMRQLAAFSAERFRDIQDRVGMRTTSAEVFWVTDAAQVLALRQVAVNFSINDEPLSPEILSGRLPVPLALGANEVVLRGGVAVSYDPGSIARALIADCLAASNASCVEGVGVCGIDARDAGVALRLDDDATLLVARAIVAVGPWIVGTPNGRTIADSLGAVPALNALRIKKVVALHIDRVPPPNAAAVFMPDADAYLMPLPMRKQWLFSFRADEWDCRPQKGALKISGRDRDIADAIIARYLPGVRDAARGGRVFCDAYTPTGEPLVERVPDAPVVIVGAGSGAGFRLSPGLADEALRAVAA